MTHIPMTRPSECDDFRGFYPLKSITMDKIISSTNDLEKVTYDLMLLLDSNPDSVTIEQSEKVFIEAVSTVETSLISFLNYVKIQNSPNLRSVVANTSRENALLSLFYDYTQLAVKVYNQKIFYNPSFFPFIIFYTNLCCYYIDIFQNPTSNSLKKDFQSAWNEYHTISTRIQYFYIESGLISEFKKFESQFDQVEMLRINKISENNTIIFEIEQSLKVVNKDIRSYGKDEMYFQIIQNIIIDLEVLRSNFVDLRNFSSESDQIILNKKINAINALLITLESCVSFNKLSDMANKLNVLIRSDVFTFPNTITKNDYNNWICFKLSMQAIQLNLKVFISIRYFLNEVDLKAINCYKLIKKIMTSINDSTNDLKMPETVSQFLEDMKQVKPLSDTSAFQSFVSFYEENVESILKNFDDKFKEYANRVKGYFDSFKSYSKIFEEKKSLITATNRFNFFLNFEDCYKTLLKAPHGDLLKINESYFKIKYYLDLNIIHYSNQILLNNVSNIYSSLTGNPEIYNSVEKRRNLKSMWKTMLNIINSIYLENDSKDSDQFLCFFQLFIKASLAVLELNEKEKSDKYEKVITFILSSFPKIDRIRASIPIQTRIDELRSGISDIQTLIIKVNEVVFSQSEKKEPSESILYKFYECEEGINDISQSIKQLETIRQSVQFFTLYESFISTYNLDSSLPVSHPGPPVSPTLFDCFPNFTNDLIYILKSPYLNISLTPNFLKKLIGFIRSLMTNENLNRKESFSKIINEIPFIDYSKLFRMAFLNFLKIESLVREELKVQKSLNMNEPEPIIQSINDKEKKYNEESYYLKKWIINLVISFKIDNSSFEFGNGNFISAVIQISPNLYQKVQKYWNKMVMIFRFYDKFNSFIKTTQEIRNELQIENKEFPKKLFQYLNFTLNICLSLNAVSKSNYIPNEMKIMISEFNQKLNEVRSNYKFLIYEDVKQLDDNVFIPLLIKMQDLVKDLLQTDVSQFTNTLRSIMAKMLPVIAASCNNQNYTRYEEIVSSILLSIDRLEADEGENKFTILFEIKQKVKQFKLSQEPLFVEFYKLMKNEISCEINISFIKSQISIHNIFILQLISENHNIIESLTASSSSLHQINHLPSICQIPDISRKFEEIVNKITSTRKTNNDEDEEKDDTEKVKLLSKLTSQIIEVKNSAESHIRKIIGPSGITQLDILRCSQRSANYRKLVTLYKGKLELLQQLRDETRSIKLGMNDKLDQIQTQIADANQEGLRLKFELKKLSEIEKAQLEYFNKPAIENLKWAKKFLSLLIPKNAERRKNAGKTMNPVLPVIHSEIQKENSLPKNAKVSYAMVVEIEQRFQKAVEKNKKLWEKAKSFTKTNKNDESEAKLNENESLQKNQNNESNGSFKECDELVKNGEIVKEFNATVETVYDLFKRSNFLQQILFSTQNNEREGFIIPYSSSSSSSSSYYSSGSSGSINSSSSIGSSGIQLGSGGNTTYDEEEIVDMLDAFNNELFDRSMKFFFINKMLQRKNEKKSRRKIKVKKHKKSVLRDILDDEIHNQ